jgi:hypothetical protein
MGRCPGHAEPSHPMTSATNERTRDQVRIGRPEPNAQKVLSELCVGANSLAIFTLNGLRVKSYSQSQVI